ncbi:MAG: hypothetical protein CL912_16635 [Deltaproteobacteria bacterium]|nr:hypothetical protein [Deltaproteobacteria bacterium]
MNFIEPSSQTLHSKASICLPPRHFWQAQIASAQPQNYTHKQTCPQRPKVNVPTLNNYTQISAPILSSDNFNRNSLYGVAD